MLKKCKLQDLEDGDKTGKRKKLETHRIGPGIWRETLKKVENEKHTVGAGIWREN